MQAKTLSSCRCKECHWPVIHALCNDGMMLTPPYNSWDWWYYCSNKTCINHHGDGVFQDTPKWVESKEPK